MPLNWKEDYWTKPIKSKRLFDNPVLVRKHLNFIGEQRIYRYPNGYGASVVRWKLSSHPPEHTREYGSYTANENQWELAVVKFKGKSNTDFEIVCDTDITTDVLGYLSEDDVETYLKQIKALYR